MPTTCDSHPNLSALDCSLLLASHNSKAQYDDQTDAVGKEKGKFLVLTFLKTSPGIYNRGLELLEGSDDFETISCEGQLSEMPPSTLYD